MLQGCDLFMTSTPVHDEKKTLGGGGGGDFPHLEPAHVLHAGLQEPRKGITTGTLSLSLSLSLSPFYSSEIMNTSNGFYHV